MRLSERFWTILPNKDKGWSGLAVRNINNAKVAVFFGSFFVYIVNEGHREDGENFRALDLGIYRLLGALGLHSIGIPI